MKVSVAARQLSQSMAAAIETFCSAGALTSEAIYTVLSADSPHWEFWSAMLLKMRDWKIINKEKG